MNNDEHQQDYRDAVDVTVGADRMALGLSSIPDSVRGDMSTVKFLRKELEFYRDSLKRIANTVGVESPLQLVMRAENNEENYVDILIKIIKEQIKP